MPLGIIAAYLGALLKPLEHYDMYGTEGFKEASFGPPLEAERRELLVRTNKEIFPVRDRKSSDAF